MTLGVIAAGGRVFESSPGIVVDDSTGTHAIVVVASSVDSEVAVRASHDSASAHVGSSRRRGNGSEGR